MADETSAQTQQPTQAETDWKAEAKKWEARAKENFEKAQAYDKSQAAAKVTADANKTLEQKVAELTSQFGAAQAENARMRVAAEKGVPADLLRGTDEDEMRAYADSLIKFREAGTPKSAPVIASDGTTPESVKRQSAEDAFFDVFNRL